MKKYYSATEAAKKLGINRQVIAKMIMENKVKGKKKGRSYEIPASEVKRLAAELKQEESEFPQQEKEVVYYSITEVAKKLAIDRSVVMSAVKTGKIKAMKGKHATSPYQIPETQLDELRNLTMSNQEVILENKIEPRVFVPPERNYENLVEIQKMLMEAIHCLASTQKEIALTLKEMAKKV